MSCKCQECGRKYTMDLIVEDFIWEQIKPYGKKDGSGLLCGGCIILKIEDKYQYGAISMLVY